MRRHVIGLGALTLGIAAAGCTTIGPTPGAPRPVEPWRQAKGQMYQQLAMQCLRAGDHAQARRLLEQAVQFDDRDARAIELLARLAYNDGDLATAASAAHLLLQREPTASGTWCMMGAIAEASRDVAEAERCYRRAIAVDAADPQPRIDLHRFFLEQGRLADAAQSRDELTAAFPERVEAWVDQGAHFASIGQWADAFAAYRRAFELQPQNIDIAARCAFSAVVAEQPAEVLRLSERIAPHARLGNSGLSLALVATHLEQRDYAAALAELDQLDASAPERARLRVLRGEILYRLGRLDDARTELDAALVADPSLGRAHATLAHIHLQQGRPHIAVRALRQALQHDPTNGVAHALLAAQLAGQGDATEAAEHLAQARRVGGAARLVAQIEIRFPEVVAKATNTNHR